MSHFPVSVLLNDRCLYCEHPILARSPQALIAAQQEHLAFVNQEMDRQTDKHFAEGRLVALMADTRDIPAIC